MAVKNHLTRYGFGALAAALILPATASAADGHVTYLEEVGTPERPMVIAGSDRGVVFIGAEHSLFRAYHHEQTAHDATTQPFLWVQDIDSDGRSEYIGAGVPSFVVDDNADPMWGVLDGCDSYYVGDFIEDSAAELLCIRGSSVRVWSYDGQEYFNWEGSGYSISECFGDDFDGDRKMEVACNLTNGNHLFFDIEDWFNDPTYEPPRDGVAPDALTTGGVDRTAMAGLAAGERELSVGGSSVTLGFGGGAVQLTVDGAPGGTVQVGGTGIYSAAAADLDGDGTYEIYVGGDDAVHIIRLDGTLVASVPANPNATSRDARVTVRSATANGLEDSDRDVVRASIEEEIAPFVSCYSRRMGADQFTRVGSMLYELTVDDDGDVTSASKRHSGIRNDRLESCIEGALEDLEFSPATDGTGSVSVTLDFDFVDTL
ncbi:MAG: hypothetical protein ACJAYU_005304 [Bradymonadia bacterium]|jgi:hypothetical protein